MVERKGRQPRQDYGTILLKDYLRIYQHDSALRAQVGADEQKILVGKPDLEVSAPFLRFIFAKPDIAARFPSAQMSTLELTERAIEKSLSQSIENVDELVNAQRGRFIENLEIAFLIDEEDDTIASTNSIQKSTTPTEPILDVGVTKDNKSQVVAMIHTHPPFSNVLKPSIYVADEMGESGDLYSFYRLHEYRMLSIAQGFRPAAVERPLSIIMQSVITEKVAKALFILESSQLASLPKDDYITHLKDNSHLIVEARSDEEVANALRQMGYKASIINIGLGSFDDYPLFERELPQVIHDLELNEAA